MNVLIVHAHPEKNLTVETLRTVVASDPYAMRFHAVVGPDNSLGERSGPEFPSIASEQTNAVTTGTLAPGATSSIRAEFAGGRLRENSSSEPGFSSVILSASMGRNEGE